MANRKNRRVNLWVLMIIAAILWTIGAGFHRDLSASSDETYRSYKTFTDVVELIEKNYVDPVDTKELIENAIKGMVRSLDPHSAFLLPEDFKDLQEDTNGEFTGIGIQISMRDRLVTVISPIEGTPADKAGIKAGDKIIKVDGEAIKDLQETVKKIRGPKGTTVTVTILRKGEAEPLEFTLTRDKIPLRSVKYSLLEPGYGFVKVTHFRVTTVRDLEEALIDLESGETPLKGLVLDLRNNGGGLLDQAVSVSDLFLEEGEIVTMRGRQNRDSRVFSARADDSGRTYPMVVLINGGSASASEIVAGALQDNKRALIVGTTSFGKGSVQSLETLRDGNGLKITIARYYSPSGRAIQAEGITPDIIIQRRVLKDEERGKQTGVHFKEVDLDNHLISKPLKKTDEDPDSVLEEKEKKEEDTEEEERPQQIESWVGPIDTEKLKSDNQIMRALEILVGYDILRQTRG